MKVNTIQSLIYIMAAQKGKMAYQWPIIGHQGIQKYLQSSIDNKCLAHAYIFSGPSGLGKYLTATTMSAALLCQSNDTLRPCRSCPSCQELEKNIHTDIEIIKVANDKKNISIEQIRQLQHKLALRSFLTSYKIAIIDEAETLTEEAANALLKTLEEPTPQTIIFIIAKSHSLLPDTINSRCQIIQFNYLPSSIIEEWLINQGSTKQQATIISHYSQGRPGFALLALANPTLLDSRHERLALLIEIINGSINDRLASISTLTGKESAENKNFFQDLIIDWLSLFRDISLYQQGVNALINIKLKPSIGLLSKKYNQKKLFEIIKSLQQAQIYLAQTINPRLVLENACLLF